MIPEPHTLLLWPDGAPGALGQESDDVPTLTVTPAEDPTGAAVVICPGGGYEHLAPYEGEPVARWLANLGVTGIVLQYRLAPRYGHEAILADGLQSIRVVRSRAEEWGLDPHRIGILGFSAGGHLAASVSTLWPDRTSRPDAAVLVYPVTSMVEPFGHTGSRRNLLGEEASHDLEVRFSPERQANAETPPTFLVHTVDDDVVPVENSLALAQALRRNGVPFELHLLEHGPHGFGMGEEDPALASWTDSCAHWLRRRGFAR